MGDEYWLTPDLSRREAHPYQLMEGLTNQWSRRNLVLYPSMWEMIYRKTPSAYVLGKKNDSGT